MQSGGQIMAHFPHPTQRWGSTTAWQPRTTEMADMGHTRTQEPQATQRPESTSAKRLDCMDKPPKTDAVAFRPRLWVTAYQIRPGGVCDQLTKGEKQKRTSKRMSFFVVREAGVEPARPCEHWHLKPASLPIPPLAHWVVGAVVQRRTYITTGLKGCQALIRVFLQSF